MPRRGRELPVLVCAAGGFVEDRLCAAVRRLRFRGPMGGSMFLKHNQDRGPLYNQDRGPLYKQDKGPLCKEDRGPLYTGGGQNNHVAKI